MLSKLNSSVKYDGSTDIEFEFTDPMEALVFSYFTGSILPVDDENFIDLAELNQLEKSTNPLTVPPIWDLYELEQINSRKKVRLVQLYHISSVVSFDRTAHYGYWVKEFERKGYNLNELILYNIDIAYASQMDEGFWEYVAGLQLRNRGYFVTRFCPSGVDGQPDIIAFRDPEVSSALAKIGISSGFVFEIDLAMGMNYRATAANVPERTTAVVEAESKHERMYNAIEWQLKKRGQPSNPKQGYLESGIFDYGYVSGPDFARNDYDVGIISNESSEPFFKECSTKFSNERSSTALSELIHFLKLWVARNKTLEEILGLREEAKTIGGMLEELKYRIFDKDIYELIS